MTRQREVVLSVVSAANEHLTAQEIFFKAKSLMPSISMATVYNSLAYLCDAKLIRKLSVEDSVDKYDKSCTPHAHLMCRQCGRLTDIESDGLGELLSGYLKVDANSYSLNIEHICDECAKKFA